MFILRRGPGSGLIRRDPGSGVIWLGLRDDLEYVCGVVDWHLLLNAWVECIMSAADKNQGIKFMRQHQHSYRQTYNIRLTLVGNKIVDQHLHSRLTTCWPSMHDDVIKWKHFPRYWPFVWGIHRSPVNSPHKGQWRGALMYSLICTWVHNREAGDLRCPLWRHCNGLGFFSTLRWYKELEPFVIDDKETCSDDMKTYATWSSGDTDLSQFFRNILTSPPTRLKFYLKIWDMISISKNMFKHI